MIEDVCTAVEMFTEHQSKRKVFTPVIVPILWHIIDNIPTAFYSCYTCNKNREKQTTCVDLCHVFYSFQTVLFFFLDECINLGYGSEELFIYIINNPNDNIFELGYSNIYTSLFNFCAIISITIILEDEFFYQKILELEKELYN